MGACASARNRLALDLVEEIVTSRNNPRVKWARAAREGRERDLIWVEGPRLLQDALRSGWAVELLVSTQNRDLAEFQADGLGSVAIRSGLPFLWVSAEVMASLADTVNCQGCAAVLRRPVCTALPAGIERWLVLDRVQDPGNVGTLLRTAEAAGVQAVLLLEGCADPYGPKALRASMGASLRLPIRQGLPWSRAKELLPAGNLRLAACMEGDHTHDGFRWPQSWALVLGNEGQGIDKAIEADCSLRVSVAMEGGVESLNVAAAGAVLLFEAARQRRNMVATDASEP
jgi:TrmH family RNA methyltransferase